MDYKEIPKEGYRFGKITGKPQAYATTLEMAFLLATISESLQKCVSPFPPLEVHRVRAILGEKSGQMFNMNRVWSAEKLESIEKLDLVKTLREIYESGDWGVKKALLSHPSVPKDIRDAISRESSRRTVQKTIDQN